MTGAASRRPLARARGCSQPLPAVPCAAVTARGRRALPPFVRELRTGSRRAGQPCRTPGARSHTLCLHEPACSLSLATSFKSETASRSARGGGGRGEDSPMVRRRRRNASPVTPSRQTKRINASPRALRFRLGRVPGRRRRHGHVLEEDGRLRLEIARERRRGQHSQSNHKNHNEQRARR